MPVETQHSDYILNAPKWKKCRIIGSEGEDEVKDAGTMFLPRLGGQQDGLPINNDSDSSYQSFKERATFFPATARSVEGITGAVFRKDPIVSFPESKKSYLDSVGNEGEDLVSVSKRVLTNVMVVGRHGVLLDIPENAKANEEPFFAEYCAESILNWRTTKIGGKKTLTMVVLKESTRVPSIDDKFALVVQDKIRVLYLGNPQDDGKNTRIYYMELWVKIKKDSKEKYVLESTHTPNIRGKVLEYIPFVFFSDKGLSTDVSKSPIIDIVNINISHYKGSADLEHGLHYVALPVAWVAGFPVNTRLLIGSGVAWVSENPDAKAGYMEFTGKGLGAISDRLAHKEAQMAVLSARMLESPKKAAESADTHRIIKSGEESVIASMAGTISSGFTVLLSWAAEWMGLPIDDISVELNKDYTNIEMSPQMLTALMAALQGGNISKNTWIYNLQRGELLPDGRTIEEELDLIDAFPPMPNRSSDILDGVPPA